LIFTFYSCCTRNRENFKRLILFITHIKKHIPREASSAPNSAIVFDSMTSEEVWNGIVLKKNLSCNILC
jgi:hypothetical protein